MRLYEGTIKDFNSAVIENRVADQIRSRYEGYYSRPVSPSEFRACQQSLNFLKNSFDYTDLTSNKLVIEYELPYSTRRIDALIFGKDNHNIDAVVLIELKQWSNDNVDDCSSDGNVFVDYGRFRREQAHPLTGPSFFTTASERVYITTSSDNGATGGS